MIRLLLLTVALVLAGVGGVGSASALVIGIADQKADLFLDARFDSLGVRHVRINVPWDALQHRGQAVELDRWMALARAQNAAPLVSFGHSRVTRRSLPSVSRFRRVFRAFRARYPFVRDFATWNEANHCGEPTCRRPQLVAAYWRALTRECSRCRIAAAELLDSASMVGWVKRFRRHAKRHPRYWALHNYVEANRFKTVRLKRLLRITRGEMWLTEVGGIVARRNKTRNSARGIPESIPHQERVTRWIFEELVNVHRRIRRVYLYHWNAATPFDSWDSALVGPDGNLRPSYWVLAQAIRDRAT